jgi:histidine phosphotransfer protein HptB
MGAEGRGCCIVFISACVFALRPDPASQTMLDLSNVTPVSDAHTEESVLDAASLNQLRSLDPTGGDLFLRKVLETYLRSLDKQVESASTAFAAEQHDDLSRAAHSLKSASASVGALKFSRLCERIEHAVRRQELGGIPADMVEFKQEAARVRAAAARLLGPTSA